MVAGVGLSAVARNGKGDIDHEQGVADVVERADAEHDIDDATDSGKPDEVEQGIGGGQLSSDILQNSQGDDDDDPHGGNEQGQVEGQGKGVKRRMEIVVAPRLSTKHLDRGIERGRGGNEQT